MELPSFSLPTSPGPHLVRDLRDLRDLREQAGFARRAPGWFYALCLAARPPRVCFLLPGAFGIGIAGLVLVL